MSTFRVEITDIREVKPHHNADRLDVVKVYDWDIVTQKDKYKVGDLVVYFPVDSILPQELEMQLFPEGSKITLDKHRVKSIKIRKQISQGMICDPYELKQLNTPKLLKKGADVTQVLGITKYEPHVRDLPKGMNVKTSKKIRNPSFTAYSDIENFKYYDRVFQDGEQCYVSEKLHGTSFRAGWFPMPANTLWRKIKKFFGMLPEWQWCYGSRTVQIQDKLMHKGYYDEDVYTKMVKQYNLKELIPKGIAVYGEIVGWGIQKNYYYGCKEGEHKLYVYDFQKLNSCRTDVANPDGGKYTYVDYPLFNRMCNAFNLEPVPKLYVGPYDRKIIEPMRDGDSLVGGQKVREGIVIKAIPEATCCAGRKLFKWISDSYYLLKDGSDFH